MTKTADKKRRYDTMSKRQIKLTPEQQYMVDQTVATMRISGMEPPEELIEDLRRIAAGEKTVEESIKELDERYRQ